MIYQVMHFVFKVAHQWSEVSSPRDHWSETEWKYSVV